MKYFAIDTETTGLSYKCQMLEVAAVVDDLHDPQPIESLPKFHCFVDQPWIEGESYALWMHGQSGLLKKLAEKSSKYTFCRPGEVWARFLGFVDQTQAFNKYGQIVVAGKNFGYFDATRLEQLPNWPGPYNGGKAIWSHKFIDPGNLFWNPWEDTETLPNSKKVKQRCGMGDRVSHKAMDDALDVIKEVRVWMKSNRSKKWTHNESA